MVVEMGKTVRRVTPSAGMMARIENLLSRMTLEEKVGQMTMVENNSIEPDQVAEFYIGSVLSGGGGNPAPNSPSHWRAMVGEFQRAALKTRLGIPLIYPVDAVHGHNNVKGAVIFPHNIGLGAAADADLVERIGQVTARELLATGVQWTFAPSVSAPQDLRWGRTYEGYSEDSALVSRLGAALVRGLQGQEGDEHRVLACAKHYVADGATKWREERISAQPGSTAPPAGEPIAQADAALGQWQIDQGVSDIDEATLRALHLPPYRAAIDAGVLSVMASYSEWNARKMHGNKYLLTDVLKGELGFEGLVVTDWMAINQLDPDYYTCVVTSINAGIDMVMVPYDYRRFIAALLQAAASGDVSGERIDDALRRILRVKFEFGLFDNPFGAGDLLDSVGCAAHRRVAREAVRKSLVLLKNDGGALPLAKRLSKLIVAGAAADDIGLQCGGWSISWQGEAGAITEGATILDGLRRAVAAETDLQFAADGNFDADCRADVGIVVLHEEPYAEGFGDRADLSLPPADYALAERLRPHCDRLIVILIAGRPRIVTDLLPQVDAFVMAWLPGTEGDGLADVLFGDCPFTGTLPYSWLRSMDQTPLAKLRSSDEAPLWQLGAGIKT